MRPTVQVLSRTTRNEEEIIEHMNMKQARLLWVPWNESEN